MIDQTILQLRQLKLGGMATALQTQLEKLGTYQGFSFSERLEKTNHAASILGAV